MLTIEVYNKNGKLLTAVLPIQILDSSEPFFLRASEPITLARISNDYDHSYNQTITTSDYGRKALFGSMVAELVEPNTIMFTPTSLL